MARTRQSDLRTLLALARDKSLESRSRLVQIVGDLFFDTDQVLGERERALMTDILHRLVHDVEMSVRRRLAERLAHEPDASPELINALANDEIAVAQPILERSAVLQDIELVEIIQHRTMSHRLAIAMRDKVSAEVSEALVETGEIDVMKTLLENPNAEIAGATANYLLEESRRTDALQRPLLDRRDLGPALAKRMYWWVSAALRQHIVDNFQLRPAELDQKIEDTISAILKDESIREAGLKGGEALAERLAEARAITPQLLVQTLRQGEVSLFEHLFARHTGLRQYLVRRFVYEPGGEGLAIACKAVGIDKPDFARMFLNSRGARPGEKIVDPSELARVLTFFDRVDAETAREIVHRWRLDPEYLFVLSQLGDTAPPSAAE